MSANHKLTAVLAGRALVGVDYGTDPATLHFADGSVMTVRLAAEESDRPVAPSAGARVTGVRQQGTRLDLDFERGSTLELRTAEATSSVIVRAGDQTLQYAD
jgi:hypothetical protein